MGKEFLKLHGFRQRLSSIKAGSQNYRLKASINGFDSLYYVGKAVPLKTMSKLISGVTFNVSK